MKILLTSIMMFLLALAPNVENKQTFTEELNNGYKTYLILTEEETTNYDITIALGEEKDEQISYSVVFTPANPKNEEGSYELGIRFKSSKYNFLGGETERGDRFVYSFMPQGDDLLLEVTTKEEVTKTYTLKTYDKAAYDKEAEGKTLITGLGNGLNSTRLSRERHMGTMFILSIVFASIILISIIVIVILAITKKGLFNRQNLEEEVKDDFNYQSFVDSVQEHMNQQQNVNGFNNPIEVEATEVKEEELKEEEQPKEVYTKVRDYEFEEEQDVSKLLQDKGFNTDYKNMSSEDKNKVMLELMRMKDFKEISEQDYKNEVIKLWM